ncbi:MAG: hypothetical protein LUF92_12240 [Clostridiales bacterium]|nr:hypothetical protein [Clostridiales bacterium]
MSTIEATVSMLEVMPEDARIKVLDYTHHLFTSEKQANPFIPVTTKRILEDLDRAHQQIKDGKGIPTQEAMELLGKTHRFI